MSDDDAPHPLWKQLLLNRFVLVPAAIAALVLGWNGYVSFHNHGIVAGQVVDRNGRAVEGADVTLWAFNFTTFAEKGHVKSGPDGSFAFTDNASHNIQVSAAKPGAGRSERVPLRLYFKAQDTRLADPLQLDGGA
jgi:hypothetical protein